MYLGRQMWTLDRVLNRSTGFYAFYMSSSPIILFSPRQYFLDTVLLLMCTPHHCCIDTPTQPNPQINQLCCDFRAAHKPKRMASGAVCYRTAGTRFGGSVESSVGVHTFWLPDNGNGTEQWWLRSALELRFPNRWLLQKLCTICEIWIVFVRAAGNFRVVFA